MTKEVVIIYCSTGGNTKRVATLIQEKLGVESCDLVTTKDTTDEVLRSHRRIIFGAPTFGMGDLDRRMQRLFDRLDMSLLKDKSVAFFVMGDQVYHGKTFAGGAVKFSEIITKYGAKLVGEWKDDRYVFENSDAVSENGFFKGLVIDEINQSNLTEERVNEWLESISE